MPKFRVNQAKITAVKSSQMAPAYMYMYGISISTPYPAHTVHRYRTT